MKDVAEAVKMLSRAAFACRGIENQIWAEWSALKRCAEASSQPFQRKRTHSNRLLNI